MYAIETKNLTKKFNGFTAVDGLSLNVPEGSIYGFLGPNGAGKTTTIKMLTGLSKPTNGEIRICGREVNFGSLKNRMDIGYLPDVPSFYDWMKPEEFLYFTGELFSIEKAILMKRIENIMELVGLSGIKKKIGSFSRGMKQRLGIAQALINEPKVVFMDEPTSALDPIGRKEVMDVILKLSGKMTVFLSSHILTDIERVCDRIIILDKGKEMIEDTISNLQQRFANQAIEIELKEDLNNKDFCEILNKQNWAKNVVASEAGLITLNASNIDEAQINIPRILSEKNLAIRKFSILEPSLEDIFLKVVNRQ
jgi:ABC-2 type transport system ATP-binding protein